MPRLTIQQFRAALTQRAGGDDRLTRPELVARVRHAAWGDWAAPPGRRAAAEPLRFAAWGEWSTPPG